MRGSTSGAAAGLVSAGGNGAPGMTPGAYDGDAADGEGIRGLWSPAEPAEEPGRRVSGGMFSGRVADDGAG